MAEKGFGVKEINLIGASGTPTIESPNNLNLNAVNVAISTNVSVGGTLTVSGSLSIGGTITYEDVTNVDAIGIITARAGVVVGDTSNTTFKVHRTQGSSSTNCGIAFNNGGSLDLFTDSSGAGTSRISISAAGNIQFSTMGSTYFLLEDYVTHAGDTDTQFGFDTANSYIVKTGGTTRLAVNLSGIQVTGTVAATQLNGAGSAITNLSAANLNGTLPSNIGFGTAIAAVWHVGHTGASNYNITGPGNLNNAVNPDLYLERNKVYQFNMNASGHGFGIQTSSGTWNSSNEYTTGITNARASTGIIRFSVPNNAPSTLYYACTSSHSGMVGTIHITGGNGTHKILADANPVMEFDRGSANNTNLNLKYNGTTTGQMSVANEEFQLSAVGSNTDIAFYVNGGKRGYWKDTGELWIGSNNTYIKANQLRFGESGAAYIDQYTTGQDINFRTSVSSALDTTGMTLKSSGNLAFASAKGIDYSAHTASNSTTSVLNDYKEGTWTASVTDFNGTYSYQNGYYTKIGSLVHVDCIIIASGGTGTGSYLRIGTLPFTVTGASAYRAVGNIIGITGVVTGGDQLQVQTNAGLDYVQVMRQQNNGTVVQLNRGNLNSGGWEFQMSITYRCNT